METERLADGFDRRVWKNIRFNAHCLARSNVIRGMGTDDYAQDLALDLICRRSSYDPERASFATFADRVVAHRVISLAKTSLRRKEEHKLISLDLPVPTGDGERATLAELVSDNQPPIEDAVAVRLDTQRFVESLTEPLLECCEILLSESVTDGARAAGIHRSTAYERATRLRAKAIAFGLEVYFVKVPDTCPTASVSGLQGADQRLTGARPESAPLLLQTRPQRPRLLITETELGGWLAGANGGDRLEYHRGFLAIDRISPGSRMPFDECEELQRVTKAALNYADGGRADLVQQRLGPGEFSYLIVARRKPVFSAAELADSAR